MSKATKATFNWSDPLLLDQQLTEDERMIRDASAQYAQDKLLPRVVEAFRNEHTVRQRGAAAKIFAKTGNWRMDRLLRIDRAQSRL